MRVGSGIAGSGSTAVPVFFGMVRGTQSVVWEILQNLWELPTKKVWDIQNMWDI